MGVTNVVALGLGKTAGFGGSSGRVNGVMVAFVNGLTGSAGLTAVALTTGAAGSG